MIGRFAPRRERTGGDGAPLTIRATLGSLNITIGCAPYSASPISYRHGLRFTRAPVSI